MAAREHTLLAWFSRQPGHLQAVNWRYVMLFLGFKCSALGQKKHSRILVPICPLDVRDPDLSSSISVIRIKHSPKTQNGLSL